MVEFSNKVQNPHLDAILRKNSFRLVVEEIYSYTLHKWPIPDPIESKYEKWTQPHYGKSVQKSVQTGCR